MSVPGMTCGKCGHVFVLGAETFVFVSDLEWLSHSMTRCPRCGFVRPSPLSDEVIVALWAFDQDQDGASGINFILVEDPALRREAQSLLRQVSSPEASAPALPSVDRADCPGCGYTYPLTSGYCHLVIYQDTETYDHVVGHCPRCQRRQRLFGEDLAEAVFARDGNTLSYWFAKAGRRVIREYNRQEQERFTAAELAELSELRRLNGVPLDWYGQYLRSDVEDPDEP